MLNLDAHIRLDVEAINSPNLCARFSDEDLDRIGLEVSQGYKADKGSRVAWERRTEAAMDLALQIQKEKTFPWPNCSNIAFPLITIATMQFHARAYPSLLAGPNFVKCRVLGPDPSGEKRARAERVSSFMSFQVGEEDSAWEEQHDKLLINLAVVGTTFVKTFHQSRNKHNVSEVVLAQDLVMNYWAKTVEDCPRKTHVFPLSRNDIHERVLRGTFRDVLSDGWYSPAPQNVATIHTLKTDLRQGTAPPPADPTTSFVALEQHVSLDLDGDGYAEPYVITIEESSTKVLRIVTRFEDERAVERVQYGSRAGEIISIEPTEYFTKYSFIPSPDGGIYDIGFGILCGPLNESVNSLVNQLVDAGTMANGGGGFLGRGAKIRGGNYTFAPFEWKRVDSTGDDLHKSIVSLPVREPSNVLLQLLSLLIDYTNRITGSTDVRSGENPGQNTPASTTQAMIAEGGRIYSAIFKRCWRSMRDEFKKLYKLNGTFLPAKTTFGDKGGDILREDFLGDAKAIVPAADPNIVSDEQRFAQAQLLKQNAMMTPGYNLQEVEKRFLTALHVDGIEQIYPGPDKVKPLPNPKMQVEQLKAQSKKDALDQEKQMFIVEKLEEKRVNDAKIMQLHAQVAKLYEEAGGVSRGHEIAAFEAMIGARKEHNDSLVNQIKLMMDGGKNEQAKSNAGAVPGMAGASGDQGASGPAGGMA